MNGNRRRSPSRYLLHLTVVCLLAVTVLPAAGSVSAAGSFVELPGTPGAGSADRALAVGDDSGWVVFLPIVMRRWPPVPYAPTVAPVASPLWDSPVVLEWQGTVPDASYPLDSYVVEESQSPDFASVITYPASLTAVPYTLPTKPRGTMGEYYYRVRGHNVWGLGDYSAPLGVLLLSQSDGFTRPETGWTARRTSYWDMDLMQTEYVDGQLITLVEDKFDFAIFSPMRAAPSVPYVIRMHTMILHKANETSYGIVFGGNEGAFCDVVRATAADPGGCFWHYYRLNVIYGGYLKYNLKRIDYHDGIEGGAQGEGVSWGWWGIDASLANPDGWNTWEIRVYDSGFTVYLNGRLMNTISDARYTREPHYGIFSSNYEYNGARFAHEFFVVEPLTGAAAVPPMALLQRSAALATGQ